MTTTSALIALALTFGCKGGDDDPADDTGISGPVDADGDGFTADEDCNDDDPAINPDAVEICDTIDNDCDELVDDADDDWDTTTGVSSYTDGDADTFGAGDAILSCEVPAGNATVDGDCDDADAAQYPGADELCNGEDDSCDGGVDVGAVDALTFYADTDTDTYGDPAVSEVACVASPGFVDNADDCDDGDINQYPGADELCNGEDDDCDTEVDEDDAVDARPWFADTDTDGYGDLDNSYTACEPPSGFVGDSTDCDDTVTAVNPGATEVCNDVDDDCDGDVDGGAVDATRWYADLDGDGYGNSSTSSIACDAPSSFVSDNTDCDDTDGAINPDADETCDGIDNDCDASTTEDNTVSWTASDGTVTDLTADLTGSSSTPGTYTFSSDGDLLFCDGTFYANIDINADVSIDSYSGAADAVILDGVSTDSVFDIEGSGLTVSIENVTIQNGYASTDSKFLGGAYAGGGAVACYDTGGTSTLSIADTDMADNLGDLGGTMSIEGCETSLDQVAISGGEATYGAAAFVTDSVFDVVDSSFTDGTADYGGAFFLHYYSGSGSTMTLADSVISDNYGQYGGGIYSQNGASTCTSSGGDHGVFDNTSYAYGGLYLNSGSTWTSEGCDYGTPYAGNDNDASVGDSYDDLYAAVTGELFSIGNDHDFVCDSSGCGDTDEYSVGAEYYNYDYSYRYGNAFLADADATLHNFAYDVGADSGCSVDYMVLSSSTLATGYWTLEWEGTTSADTTKAFQDSGEVDLFLEAGTYYTFLVNMSCASGDLQLDYDNGGGAVQDAGFGDGAAYLYSATEASDSGSGVYLYLASSTSGAIFEQTLDVTVWY